MEIDIKAYAHDILSAINEIDTFLEDVPDFEVYELDIKTKRAIERNLEIIGEAMNRILKKEPDAGFSDARKIIQTRNRIIHGYDTVSDELIWTIANNSLSTLKNEVKQFLQD